MYRISIFRIHNKLWIYAVTVLLLFIPIHSSISFADSIAPISLSDLFNKFSDDVVIVHVISADEEHYEIPDSGGFMLDVCKVKTIQSFKGPHHKDDVFYISGCSTMAIGSDYLFFSRFSAPLNPMPGKTIGSYGRIERPEEWSDVGYGLMPIEYLCVFDGKEISQQCDYGVNLNKDQILLPANLKSFPQEPTAETNYHSWVRKSDMLEVLIELQEKALTR